MVFSFQARKKATKELAIEEARIDQQRIAYLARSCMTAEWGVVSLLRNGNGGRFPFRYAFEKKPRRSPLGSLQLVDKMRLTKYSLAFIVC